MPDQWADAERTLPQGSAEPGPFDSSRTPYCVGPMRAAASRMYKHVFAVMMTQGGKTESVFNIIGHQLDDDPAPILYIGPTRSNITNVIEPKVDSMLRNCSSLWEKTTKGQKYTTTRKIVSGVPLRFAWAGSTTEIKSDSARTVIIDEVDEIAQDLGDQGNVVVLGDARHGSYIDGLTIGISSPSTGNINTYIHKDTGLEHWEVGDVDDVRSPIWRLWQGGTRHEWAWPCPHCDEYFVPRFKLLWWPDDSTPEQAEKEARLTCPHCAAQIESKHKSEMNARGVYVAPGQSVTTDGEVIGPEPESSDATFWVSGLANFSSKKTFGFLAAAYVRAVRSGELEAIKTVINTDFGELFKFGGDAPDWEVVTELAREYPPESLPTGTLALTCGVDVQKDRLVYSVRAWLYKMTSYLVEEGELHGATKLDDVWSALDDLLNKDYGGQRIRLMLVDSGYNPSEKTKKPTNKIYEFCRTHKSNARPIKGRATQDKPHYATKVDVTIDGRTYKNGLQLWHLDTDYYKSWVHGRLDWPEEQDGGWFVHGEVTEDYCKQITAEARVVKPSGKPVWVKVRKDNHFLDCEMMNVAAAYMLNLNNVASPPVVHEDGVVMLQKRPKRKRRRISSPFLNK